MIGIIGLAIFWLLCTVYTVKDFYKNWNDIYNTHPLCGYWIGVNVGVIIFLLIINAESYISNL